MNLIICCDQLYLGLLTCHSKVSPSNEEFMSYENNNNLDNQSLRADMTTDFPHPKDTDVFSRWKLGDRPLWLNFSDPIITNLKQPNWNPDWVVIPENYKDGWVTITISTGQTGDPDFIPAAHPVRYT